MRRQAPLNRGHVNGDIIEEDTGLEKALLEILIIPKN